jgi:Domain of unknown function (DUF4124)
MPGVAIYSVDAVGPAFLRGSRGLVVAAAALALAAPAGATVYKCEGPGGAPMYQDEPCPPGRQLRDFDKDPPTVSVMPLTPNPVPGATTRQVLPPPPAAANGKVKNGAKAKPGSAAPVNAAGRKFIAPGINEGEVIARLGAPDMKSGGGTRKTARWMYLPAPDDPGTLTTLTFESGRLVEVERKVVR